MATKTITVDMDAYNKLKRAKREHESFSDVIKRMVKPPVDYREWLKRVRNLPPMDARMTEAIERQVRNRRSPLRKAS